MKVIEIGESSPNVNIIEMIIETTEEPRVMGIYVNDVSWLTTQIAYSVHEKDTTAAILITRGNVTLYIYVYLLIS